MHLSSNWWYFSRLSLSTSLISNFIRCCCPLGRYEPGTARESRASPNSLSRSTSHPHLVELHFISYCRAIMKSSGITTIAATVLSSAALFATSFAADLPPIVIKVRSSRGRWSSPCIDSRRDRISSMKTEPSFSLGVSHISKMSVRMVQHLEVPASQTHWQTRPDVRVMFRFSRSWVQIRSESMRSTLPWITHSV